MRLFPERKKGRGLAAQNTVASLGRPACRRQGFINSKVFCSGLDRCLRRHGVSHLKTLLPKEEGSIKSKIKCFKDYEPGFIHVDVKYMPQMPDERCRRYIYAAIDRATRWVWTGISSDKSAKSASSFFRKSYKKDLVYDQ